MCVVWQLLHLSARRLRGGNGITDGSAIALRDRHGAHRVREESVYVNQGWKNAKEAEPVVVFRTFFREYTQEFSWGFDDGYDGLMRFSMALCLPCIY
tara:strand:+ start:362 stop:652 length:291 start_codon:yes stop_codon:yes gene_type:complete